MASIESLKSIVSLKGGIARQNVYRVFLPSIEGSNIGGSEVNALCTNVNLPGRQILTQERVIGLKREKVANGFASDDINISFLLLNDYGIKDYFEAWQNQVVNPGTYEVGYKSDYSKLVRIQQLKRGFAIPPELVGILDSPIATLFDLGTDSSITDSVVYECLLLNAFPTTMSAVELNNELDGFLQVNIQLSYTNWFSRNRDFNLLTRVVEDLVGSGVTDLLT